MLKYRSIDSLIDMNTKLLPDHGELIEDVRRYRRLVWKLNHMSVTRPDITFIISAVSQFFSAPKTAHLEAIMRILRYPKKLQRGLLYSNHEHTRAVVMGTSHRLLFVHISAVVAMSQRPIFGSSFGSWLVVIFFKLLDDCLVHVS